MIDQPPAMSAERSGADTIHGVIIEGGIVCPLIRLPDGRVFSLQGIGPSQARIGQELTLSGRVVPFSTCQQGETFHVREIID